MKYVGKGIVKKDAKALLSGKAVYTDDLAPSDALTVKLLRSPHAFARIRDIDVSTVSYTHLTLPTICSV